MHNWFRSKNYSQKLDLDKGYAFDPNNKRLGGTWFMSRNHCPKLDINQGRKISKLIIDLNQKITRRNLI